MNRETPQARLLAALRAAAPASLENVQASHFGLADLHDLLHVLHDLRSAGLVDFREADFTGYDLVREVWLTPYGRSSE